MILNARQIHFKEDIIEGEHAPEPFPSIILLAMEDVTEMMVIAETLASHANQIEAKLTERAAKLEKHIKELEKEVLELKKKHL
jgi:hypothetical protein